MARTRRVSAGFALGQGARHGRARSSAGSGLAWSELIVRSDVDDSYRSSCKPDEGPAAHAGMGLLLSDPPSRATGTDDTCLTMMLSRMDFIEGISRRTAPASSGAAPQRSPACGTHSDSVSLRRT